MDDFDRHVHRIYRRRALPSIIFSSDMLITICLIAFLMWAAL